MKRIIFLLLLYIRLFSILLTVLSSLPSRPRASLFHPVSPARTRFSFRDPPLSLGLTSIFTNFQDPYFPVSRIERIFPHTLCVDRDRRAIQFSIFRVTTVLTDHVNDTLSSRPSPAALPPREFAPTSNLQLAEWPVEYR